MAINSWIGITNGIGFKSRIKGGITPPFPEDFDAILLEDGTPILLENEDLLLLEDIIVALSIFLEDNTPILLEASKEPLLLED